MNSVSQDSSKTLSEKLALQREVGVLKPEIEHLRSQLAHQKDVLSQKLALERQLNALEVELANEKRAVEKAAQQKANSNQEEEDALRKQVEDLEKELAKERKTAQKKEQEHETKSQEIEDEIQSLREKLAATEKNLAAEKRKAEQSNKSKNTATAQMEEEMEQLRETVAELEKAVAAEKRAAERKVKNKAAGSEEELAQLREELDEVKQSLADEKKQKEQLQKDHEQALVDAEERQNALSDRVEKLRSKLRDTVDELKKARADLEKAQERPSKISAAVSTTTTIPLKKPGIKANAKKKRTADDVAMEDKVLMTPGAADDRPKRPLKKRGFDTTVLTEKSNFSITPFLNKTINVGDASAQDASTPSAPPPAVAEPAEAALDEEEQESPANPEPSAEEEPAPATKTKQPVGKKPRGRPPRALSETSPNTKNTKSGTATTKTAARISPVLENVPEEAKDDEETCSNQENQPVSASIKTTIPKLKRAPSVEPANTKSGVHTILPDLDVTSNPEPKKKKRKLLGASNPTTTIFEEEDEGEKVKVLPSITAAPVEGEGATAGQEKKVTKRPPVAKSAAAKKGILGGVKNSFAAGGKTFSPLKRERRGVGASFLV